MNGQLTNFTGEPPYANPNLQVFIFGLGSLWFDTTNDYAGFGFVEVSQNPHPLTLEICENGQIIRFEEISKEKTISISGNIDNRGMGDQFHSSNHPQEDDPLKPDNDFRWMIDLDSHYDPHLEFHTKPEFYARLNANVGDAIFFTEHKSQGNAFLQDLSGQPVHPPSPVGQVIGFCSQKEGAELRIDDGENLLPDANRIYTVILRYHCSNAAVSNSVNSDFSQIYDVIFDDGNLQKYDLVYENEELPWISGCEMAKMNTHSQNIASIFAQNPSLSLTQMEEIAGQLEYINHRLSCEVACQDIIFGKYSRTVS